MVQKLRPWSVLEHYSTIAYRLVLKNKTDIAYKSFFIYIENIVHTIKIQINIKRNGRYILYYIKFILYREKNQI